MDLGWAILDDDMTESKNRNVYIYFNYVNKKMLCIAAFIHAADVEDSCLLVHLSSVGHEILSLGTLALHHCLEAYKTLSLRDLATPLISSSFFHFFLAVTEYSWMDIHTLYFVTLKGSKMENKMENLKKERPE